MDSGWAAVVVACGALVISGVAVAISNRSTGYARGQADAAQRQAVAAEAQVEYMRRQLEVMEQGPAPAAGTQVPDSVRGAPYVSPWSVVWAGKSAFLLANGGSEPAFDVSLTFDQNPARAEPTTWARIDARASARVMIFRAFGASPDHVTVHWRRSPEGEPMEWTTALL